MPNLRQPMIPSYAREAADAGALITPYNPVSVLAAPQQSVSTDRETIVMTVPSANAASQGGALLVGQTTRPWSGIDVFVTAPIQPSGFVAQGTLSIFVYALVKGVKVLAGTGRLILGQIGAAQNPITLRDPTWVCAVRGLADAWQVESEITLQGAIGPGQFVYTICASNQPAQVGESFGAVPFANVLGTVGAFPSLYAIPAPTVFGRRLELLTVMGTNLTATPRYLHVHDTATFGYPTAPGLNGLAPQFSLSMGSAIGAQLIKDRINYRCRGFLALVVSSTAINTTQVNDCAIGATVR